MSEPTKAVFLSYASQDAEAAKRIADALRAAGVEVWFDQSELRGGDSWDAKIRRQIKECALFVPIISAATNSRAEGYFRLEWKLAVDRSHLMADDAHFLFPVVIDDTPDATARVPDKFRDVQWTRLNVKDTPETLALRVGKLLSGSLEAGRPRPAERGEGAASPRRSQPAWLRYAWAGVGIVFALVYAVRPLWQATRHPDPKPAVVAPAAPSVSAAQLSEARQLAARARAMSLDKYDSTVEDFTAAESLLKRALELDANDAEIWAVSSLLNFSFGSRGFDHAPARIAAARSHAERALSLDPNSMEGLFALARWQRDNEQPAVAEASFNKILAREPNHIGALSGLAWIYDGTDRVDESAALYERVAALPGGNPALARYTEFLLFFHRARFEEADRCIRQSIASQPSANSQAGLANLLLTWKGDADGAARVLALMPTAARSLPRTIWTTALVQLCQRAPAEALQTLDRFSDDYIQDNWFAGPKTYWVGRAHALAGRKEAARLAWETGLDVVNARLKNAAQNHELHLMRGELLALLGQTDEALREAHTVEELARGRLARYWFGSSALIYGVLGRADDALPLLEKLCVVAPVDQIVGWPLTPALLRLDPIWDKIRDDPRFQKLATSDQPVAAAPAKVDEKSVAVLAFANLSDDKANEYFSDGISEELLNVLAKVPGLKVSARTSAFSFKGREVPVPEIAKQLGVAYVVEGSVRKQGDKVRITAQLIKATDGFHVWSDTFTRDLKDIFAVQDEIAGLIAQNLELKLGGTARAAGPSVDPEAYNLYLQGRQALLRRTNEGYAQAERFFQQAEARAPAWAPVYTGLADTWRLRAFGGSQVPFGPDGAWTAELTNAKSAAEQALALDPNLAEAYVSLGGTYMIGGKLAEAERLIRRALELNPNLADAYLVLGRVHSALGRMDESLAAFQRAAELNPLAPRILDNWAAQLGAAGRYEESRQVIERAAALQPYGSQIQCYLARIYTWLDRREAALRQARQLEDNPAPEERNFRLLEAAGVYVAFGRQPEAEALAAKIPATAPEKAIAYAYLGRPQEAIPLLGRLDFGWIDDLLWGRGFEPIRRDPGYLAYLAKVGLTEADARARAWRVAHPLPEKGGR